MVADPVPVGTEGDYWAVLIGIDEYADPAIPDLESAVKDATAVQAVLEARYGFAPDRITRLLNDDATRSKIEGTLYEMGRNAGENDSVFIYYAGHGQYDRAKEHGWWIPVEADPNNPGSFIKNETITSYAGKMQARHVYLVTDSLFSGNLFAKTRRMMLIDKQRYAELDKRSRWVLSSGADEPVADPGLEGHSPFASSFLKTLQENTEPYLVPSEIHARVAQLVTNVAGQRPRGGPLMGAGDEGGQFVFRLTEALDQPPPGSGGIGFMGSIVEWGLWRLW